MNAYASILSNIQNADDIGQSLECVIIVVGCDGTGSVGSSGDTIIGSNNGNDDNNTHGIGGTTLPPLKNCENCVNNLSDLDFAALRITLDLEATATASDMCESLQALETLEDLVVLLRSTGFDELDIMDFLICLGMDVTLSEVEVI
jgi:hypothetical protein